jgi:hypothetical protein
VVDAVLDDHILELDSAGGTTVTGQFRHPVTNEPFDTLTEGTCTPDGIRPTIKFVRRHDGNLVTTVYRGKVIFIGAPSNRVFIRGRFTRTTVNADMTTTTLSGDWETEKPT